MRRRWAFLFQYLPIEQERYSPYIGRYRTFGLRGLQERRGRTEELMLLPDVSTDFPFVLRLAHILTKKQLDPVHLLDVIEDAF